MPKKRQHTADAIPFDYIPETQPTPHLLRADGSRSAAWQQSVQEEAEQRSEVGISELSLEPSSD